MIEGYNIAFQVNSKTMLGRTQDDLSITANTKESLTKDDAGEKRVVVTGHEVTFSCSGLIDFNASTSSATKLDRDDIIALSLVKGSSAPVPVVYSCQGGDTYTGNAIITDYGESSNAEDEATYSISFKISGAFTKQS